jgi:hypothetical protein
MNGAKSEFDNHIAQVRDLRALSSALRGGLAPIVDLSDLLRMQLVLSVSALDRYIHEIVRLGMLESFQGFRTPAIAFSKYLVPMEGLLSVATQVTWLNLEIRSRHSLLSFQKADKIADALRLITDKAIWEAASAQMSIPVRDLKLRIDAIADRRNKIVHEFDADPAIPGARWNIDERMVDETIAFIDDLCEVIHNTVT